MNIWKRYSMRVSKNWVKFNKMFTLSPWDASYVQKRLGHKDIQTTINTYAHLNERDLKEAFNKFKQESTSAEQS